MLGSRWLRESGKVNPASKGKSAATTGYLWSLIVRNYMMGAQELLIGNSDQPLCHLAAGGSENAMR